MDKRLFVGIDVGSASVRAGIFDAAGQRLAFAVRAIKQFHPRPLYVEQSSARHLGADLRARYAKPLLRPASTRRKSPPSASDATCSLVAVGKDGQGISVAEDGQRRERHHHVDGSPCSDADGVAQRDRRRSTGLPSAAKSASKWSCPRRSGSSRISPSVMPRPGAISTSPIIWSGAPATPMSRACAR